MSASKTRIYFRLQRAAHRLKTEADASLMRDCGLTTAQAAVLNIVSEDGPVSQKHVAETLSQRESAITAMAGRLVKSGLITKSRSQKDSRAFELRITDAGTEALRITRTTFGAINAELDARIDAQGMAAFADNLDKVLDLFET